MRSIAPALLLVLAAVRPPAAEAHPHGPPTICIDLKVREGRVLYVWSLMQVTARSLLGFEGTIRDLEEEEARARVLSRAVDFLRERNRVLVDGERVPPEGVRVKGEVLGDGYPFLLITLAYPCEGRPQTVDLVWEDFTEAAWQEEQAIPVTIHAAGQVDTVNLSPEEPQYVWHARDLAPPDVALVEGREAEAGRLPLASVGAGLVGILLVVLLRRRLPAVAHAGILVAALSGAYLLRDVGRVELRPPWAERVGVPSEAQARSIFETLHRNLYEAFRAGSEEQVYDLLAKSVDRAILDEMYVDVYESLILREQGGAIAEIEGVEHLGGEVELPHADETGGAPEFRVDWSWEVLCAITHWGHTHERTNRYRALYDVRHDGRSWKIARMEVLKYERVDETEGLPTDDGGFSLR